MLLLSSNLYIPLDVLNNRHEAVARFDARLLELHGDWATLALPAGASVSLVHWGSLVRFWVSDGVQAYEAQGVVAARDTELAPDQSGDPSTDFETGEKISDNTAGDPSPDGTRQIVVRLWQCRPFGDRRAGPRRWTRFGVRLRPLASSIFSADQADPFASLAPDQESPCWEHGWAVDVSAGGMRLRTYDRLSAHRRLALQFWLPDVVETRAASHARCFNLFGRVLRSASAKSRASVTFEAMVSFEQLPPEDGFALSRFLMATTPIITTAVTTEDENQK